MGIKFLFISKVGKKFWFIYLVGIKTDFYSYQRNKLEFFSHLGNKQVIFSHLRKNQVKNKNFTVILSLVSPNRHPNTAVVNGTVALFSIKHLRYNIQLKKILILLYLIMLDAKNFVTRYKSLLQIQI